MKVCLAVLSLITLSACHGGPDPIRLASERANWTLAKNCANGWFNNQPFTPHDQKLVEDAFSDWDRALKADEALISPIPLPITNGGDQ